MNRFRLLPALLCVLAAMPALAHKPSDTYLRIDAQGETLAAEWDIALRDLEMLVGLDADRDGDITWGELKRQRQAVTDYALARLAIDADGSPCALRVTDLMVNRHSDGAYAVLVIATDRPADAQALTVRYDLLFDLDPTHRGLVLYDNGQVASTHILTPDQREAVIASDDPGLWRAFVHYVREGVWHIWIGLDHILFLLCLLLPAVWLRDDGRWQPVERLRPTLLAVAKIVTVFTLAHSVTLWLAVMEYVTLPGRAVEAVIAASIIVTALYNLMPVIRVPGWAIALGFGLVHGFGFANVLIDLGLSDSALALSLLGFNVGVELGQLAIVLVFVPIAYALRETSFYKWGVFRAGSILVLLIAGAWFYERAFNADLGLPI